MTDNEELGEAITAARETARSAGVAMKAPGPDPMVQFTTDLFGAEGATVYIELVGGERISGERQSVFLGHGAVPFAVRIKILGEAEATLVPWHAIRTYVVRP